MFTICLVSVTLSAAKWVKKWPKCRYLYIPIYLYISISRKTLRSLRPEIGEFAGRAEEDRAVEDRAGEDMAGQGMAGGHIKSGHSKSRAGRGQKAGQGMMGIVQYE